MNLPLLEYLDKLEATAKAAQDDITGVRIDRRAAQAHAVATQPKATLALIAKLREVEAAMVRIIADGRDDSPELQELWRELFEIEVPE